MSVSIFMDSSGFEMWAEAEPARSAELVKSLKKEAGFLMLDELLRTAPYRSGRYVGSIEVKETEEGVEVGPTVSYSPFVEFGTGMFSQFPHLIYPKKAQALHWISTEGKDVFAKYIIGMPGQFPVKRAREAVKPKIFDLSRKIWRITHGI